MSEQEVLTYSIYMVNWIKLAAVLIPITFVPCLGDQQLEDKDNHGHPMRPHIVFFGENVPMFPKAEKLVKKADIVIVIGTSLQVYPANGLVNLAPYGSLIYLIDPNPNTGFVRKQVITIKEKAGKGVPKVVSVLLDKNKRFTYI